MSRSRLSFGPRTYIEPRPREFHEKPAIRWPSIAHGSSIHSVDLGRFPSLGAIQSKATFWKNNEKDVKERLKLSSEAFLACAKGAEERLWILDPFFDEMGYRLLREVVSDDQGSRIRIVSCSASHMEVERWIADLESARNVRKLRDSARTPGSIEWRTTARRTKGRDDPRFHDRYAVVDSELWHFGSAVGGAHPSLTTFSRGWDADVRGAVTFFKDLWNTLEDPARKRR